MASPLHSPSPQQSLSSIDEEGRSPEERNKRDKNNNTTEDSFQHMSVTTKSVVRYLSDVFICVYRDGIIPLWVTERLTED